jgi:hypothetical protein
MVTKITSFLDKNFTCEICHFNCSKRGDLNRHLLTAKHKRMCFGTFLHQNNFSCPNCQKIYLSRNGLWSHKKTCTQTINHDMAPSSATAVTTDVSFLTNLVLEVVKNNSELIKQNQEYQKKMTETQHTTNHINSHNKTFNMNFFLNEECKDAMNIMEFVDTFKLQFSDLENVGKLGYVEGISEIIIKKLNEMDVHKRPIHCSDAKRETIYVKDNNVWGKENSNHDKLRLAIRYITKKNTDMLNPWCQSHPGSLNSENYLNDIYLNIVTQAMGGKGGLEENENKIIKKISKTVLIDK